MTCIPLLVLERLNSLTKVSKLVHEFPPLALRKARPLALCQHSQKAQPTQTARMETICEIYSRGHLLVRDLLQLCSPTAPAITWPGGRQGIHGYVHPAKNATRPPLFETARTERRQIQAHLTGEGEGDHYLAYLGLNPRHRLPRETLQIIIPIFPLLADIPLCHSPCWHLLPLCRHSLDRQLFLRPPQSLSRPVRPPELPPRPP